MGRIYTRSGDQGETSLVDGRRVSKASPRVEAYGEVDEANAWLGVARAHTDDAELDRWLAFAQHRLFNCSSNLATTPGSDVAPTEVTDDDITALENAIDRFEEETGKLSRFILPGGSKAAGFLHVARTVSRRVERRIVELAALESVDANVLKFVNRLSDFLFAAARFANHRDGAGDVPWEAGLERP